MSYASDEAQSIIANSTDTAQQIVSDGLAFLNSLKDQSSFHLNDIFGGIYAPEIPQPEIIDAIDTNIDNLNLDANIDRSLPKPPELEIPQTDYGAAPNYTIEDPEVDTSIDIPQLDIAEPSTPTLSMPEAPIAPDIESPEMPTLDKVTLPDLPNIDTSLDFPEPPPLLELEAPSWSYTPPSEYKSALMDILNNKLQNNIVNGGTGLPEDIEQAIYDRQKERDEQQINETINQAMETWASRGFDLPPGMLMAEVDKILLDYQHSKLDRSRDIAINQAELEQKNMQFSIQAGIDLERLRVQIFMDLANIALNAAKSYADIGIAIYNAKVTQYRALVDSYRTQMEAVRQKLEAQVTKLEVYKGQLDGARLQEELNKDKLNVFNSQLEAVRNKIAIYNSKVETYKSFIQTELAKIDAFKGQIEAYVGKVNAYATKVSAISKKLEIGKLKVDIANTKASLKRTEMEAYRTKVEAEATKAQITNEINKAKLSSYESEAQVKLKEIESSLMINQSKIDEFKAKTDLYKTKAQIQVEKSKLNVMQYEAQLEAYKNDYVLALEQAKYKLNSAIEAAKISVTAATAGGDIYSNMVAGALSAINAIASVSAQTISSLGTE